MSESDDSSAPPAAAPQPITRRWRGPSLVWLVPIVALAVGIWLLVRSILTTGPLLTIQFETADGLRPGQTEVRFKEVVVGHVETVAFNDDRTRVLATVRLARSAASLAVEDTRFWVVKPRIDIGGVSGLETLFSGAYIGMDAGVSKESQTEFEGLPGPPFLLRGEPGRGFALAPATWAHSTSVRPFTTAAPAWAASWATSWTRTPTRSPSRFSCKSRTTSSSTHRRASGTPAAWTSPSTRTA